MTTAVSRVEVVRVSGEHVPALAEFYRRVWDPDATAVQVNADRSRAAASNPATPGEAPPTWVVFQDDTAIAHVTTIPIRLWLSGRDQPAHWVKGLWVLPEHQRSAAGFLVLKEAAAALDGVSLALVHEPAAIRLFQALGFTDLGLLPNRLRVLRASTVIARLDPNAVGLGGLPGWTHTLLRAIRPIAPILGKCIDAALATSARIRGGSLGSLAAHVDSTCDIAGVNALWEAVRPDLPPGPSRTGDALARRYPAGEYLFVHARSASGLAGIGIVKRPRTDGGDPRLAGVRVATLADMLFPPGALPVAAALLRGAERAARQLDADALLCSASTPVIEPLLVRRAYVTFPANLHVLARSKGEPLPSSRISDWWFTRGDSEGDGTF